MTGFVVSVPAINHQGGKTFSLILTGCRPHPSSRGAVLKMIRGDTHADIVEQAKEYAKSFGRVGGAMHIHNASCSDMKLCERV